MVSATATTLASNRRKLRLAQHNNREIAPEGAKKKKTVGLGGRTNNKHDGASPPAASNTARNGTVAGASSGSGNAGGGSGDGTAGTTGTSASSGSNDSNCSHTNKHHHEHNSVPIPPNSAGHCQNQHQWTRNAGGSREMNSGGGGNVTTPYRRRHQRTESLLGGAEDEIAVNHPQHLQEGSQHQHRQTPQQQSGPTSRGRSRRSRAATRRVGCGSNGTEEGGRRRRGGGQCHSDREVADTNHVGDEVEEAATPYPSSALREGGRGDIAGDLSGRSGSRKLALNLHVADSVDSDDNGTCFNSIGTTTPRQPSPRHHHATTRNPHASHQPQSHPLQLNEDEGQISLTTRKNRRCNRVLSSSEALSPLHEAKSPLASPQNNYGSTNSANNASSSNHGSGSPMDPLSSDSHTGCSSRRTNKKVLPPEATHFGKFGSETFHKPSLSDRTNHHYRGSRYSSQLGDYGDGDDDAEVFANHSDFNRGIGGGRVQGGHMQGCDVMPLPSCVGAGQEQNYHPQSHHQHGGRAMAATQCLSTGNRVSLRGASGDTRHVSGDAAIADLTAGAGAGYGGPPKERQAHHYPIPMAGRSSRPLLNNDRADTRPHSASNGSESLAEAEVGTEYISMPTNMNMKTALGVGAAATLGGG